MNPQAKKRGGMMFGGHRARAGMSASVNKGKTNHGKTKFFAKGGDISYKDPDTSDLEMTRSPADAAAMERVPGEALKANNAAMFAENSSPDREYKLKSSAAPPKVSDRGMAYRAARAAGKKTFTFGGKSYTTESAEEAAGKRGNERARKESEASGAVGNENARKASMPPSGGGPRRGTGPARPNYTEGYYSPKFAKGGSVNREATVADVKNVASQLVSRLPAMGMKKGGMAGCYSKGGGVERKGKTSVKMVKMASGGSVSSRADGIASKGKTNCKIC